jgi:hypothetical protein
MVAVYQRGHQRLVVLGIPLQPRDPLFDGAGNTGLISNPSLAVQLVIMACSSRLGFLRPKKFHERPQVFPASADTREVSFQAPDYRIAFKGNLLS